MKEIITIKYLKIVCVTLVRVNNSDSFMVKTQTGFLKSSLFSAQLGNFVAPVSRLSRKPKQQQLLTFSPWKNCQNWNGLFFQGRCSNDICQLCRDGFQHVRIFKGCVVWIENSVRRVTVRHHKSCRAKRFSLVMEFSVCTYTTIMDSFSCILFLRQLHF